MFRATLLVMLRRWLYAKSHTHAGTVISHCVLRTRLGVSLMVSWRVVIGNATTESIIYWFRARCISQTTRWRCAGLSLCRILCLGWACGVGRPCICALRCSVWACVSCALIFGLILLRLPISLVAGGTRRNPPIGSIGAAASWLNHRRWWRCIVMLKISPYF